MTPAAQLRAAGLRATRPRIAVVEALQLLGPHRAAEELLAVLAERDVPLARSSVYQILGDLVRHGLVMVADAGPGRALYEIAQTWHHHFVCRRCGQVLDVPCLVGERPCLAASLPGVRIEEAQVIFRGMCEACAGLEDTRSRPISSPWR